MYLAQNQPLKGVNLKPMDSPKVKDQARGETRMEPRDVQSGLFLPGYDAAQGSVQ